MGEPHIFPHRVRQVVVHGSIGEIGVGPEEGERIVRVEAVRRDIDQRIGGGIGREAKRVPLVARAENRQHQINVRLPTPLAKGLAKIGFGFGNVPAIRGVEKTAHPDGAVAQEAIRLIARSVPFPLEQIVCQTARVGQIASEIPNPLAEIRWHNEAIDTTGRFDNPRHYAFVKAPHHPVKGLERVRDRFGQHHALDRRGVRQLRRGFPCKHERFQIRRKGQQRDSESKGDFQIK